MTVQRPFRAEVDRVFGTPPEQSPCAEPSTDVTAENAERERWLRENVPPHSV